MTALVTEPRASRACIDCGGAAGWGGEPKVNDLRCWLCETKSDPAKVAEALLAVRMRAYEFGRERAARGLSSRRYDVPKHLERDYLNGWALGIREWREKQGNPIRPQEPTR